MSEVKAGVDLTREQSDAAAAACRIQLDTARSSWTRRERCPSTELRRLTDRDARVYTMNRQCVHVYKLRDNVLYT